MQPLVAAFVLLAGAQDEAGARPGDEFLRVDVPRPRWKGLTLRADAFGGSGLRMHVSDPTEIRNDGITPERRSTLRLDEKDVEAVGAGVVLDFDLFRLSLDVFVGDWEGKGRLTEVDGPNPPVVTAVEAEGETWGLHVGLHWPGLRGRTGAFEASLGPQLSVGWQHEEIDRIPAASLPVHDDSIDELVARTGLRLGVRLHLGGEAWLSLEGEGAWQFGSSVGFVREFSAGVGLRF